MYPFYIKKTVNNREYNTLYNTNLKPNYIISMILKEVELNSINNYKSNYDFLF